jgi:hypothetical protein
MPDLSNFFDCSFCQFFTKKTPTAQDCAAGAFNYGNNGSK